MTIVGIDPGLSGAVAVLRDLHGFLPSSVENSVEVFNTPTGRVTRGVHNKHVYIPSEMLALVYRINQSVGVEGVHYFVEKSQPMPKNGSQGNFSAGYCTGLWEMALVASQTPYTLVHSQTWKRVMVRDLPKGKDSSVLRAKQLFPQIPLLLKKDHNKAEALLIAEYGRRLLHQSASKQEERK